jgi:hypothetical protein
MRCSRQVHELAPEDGGISGLIADIVISRSLTQMYGPAVRRKGDFGELVVSGLASMYPAFVWSALRSGPSWVSARVRSH